RGRGDSMDDQWLLLGDSRAIYIVSHLSGKQETSMCLTLHARGGAGCGGHWIAYRWFALSQLLAGFFLISRLFYSTKITKQ
ncbi:MAG: hypothetical protein ACKPKO_58395, partial [Candidatus Fonsibacter sp.]